MAWTIDIEATGVEDAKAKVIAKKHEIADGQHALDPVAHAESWVQRAANDAFENVLNQLPKNAAKSIRLSARGALQLDQLAIEVA